VFVSWTMRGTLGWLILCKVGLREVMLGFCTENQFGEDYSSSARLIFVLGLVRL